MPEYQIIQMKAPNTADVTVEDLAFPKVPLEALIEDPDHRNTPYGTPARVVLLNAIQATAPANPTAADQLYYNTATRKIVPAKASGNTFVWDTDASHMEDPQAGLLYKVRASGSARDTLYVKSIDALGVGIHALEMVQYTGPFRCAGSREDTTWVVTVDPGNVYAGWKEYQIPADTSGITMTAGQSLYLVGTSGSTDATFQYTTDATAAGDMRVRIAYNNAGNLVQCQYGDIQTSALT